MVVWVASMTRTILRAEAERVGLKLEKEEGTQTDTEKRRWDEYYQRLGWRRAPLPLSLWTWESPRLLYKKVVLHGVKPSQWASADTNRGIRHDALGLLSAFFFFFLDLEWWEWVSQTPQVMTYHHNGSRQAPALEWLVHLHVFSHLFILHSHLPPLSGTPMCFLDVFYFV